MHVIKRDGSREPVLFDKITERLRVLVTKPPALVGADPTYVAAKVIPGVHDGVTTQALDVLAMETAASLVTTHPDYGTLAGRLAVSNLHKETEANTRVVLDSLLGCVSPHTKEPAPLLARDVYDIMVEHIVAIDAAINHDRDYERYDYFAMKTLQHSYLLKVDGRIAERPQVLRTAPPPLTMGGSTS